MQTSPASTPLVLAGAVNFFLGRARNTNETAQPDHCCRYTNEVVEDMPWSIHIIEIERGRHDFEFCTTLGKGDVIGMGTVLGANQSVAARIRPAIGGDQWGLL